MKNIPHSLLGAPLAGRILPAFLIAIVLTGAALKSSVAAPVTFGPGSLIIPMDTGVQDLGMLRAYGLVYELLRKGVPVYWVINPAKVARRRGFQG